MKFKYFCRCFRNGKTIRTNFVEKHYKEAETLVTPDYGMHEVSALLLINKWNDKFPNHKFWLEKAASA